MKTNRFLLLLASISFAMALTISGCATQRVQLDERNPGIPTYEGKSHFFLAGIGQTKTINAGDFCGYNQVSSVETYVSAIDAVLTYLTIYIYSPYSYSIYCRKDNQTNFNNNNNGSTSNNNNNNNNIVVPNIIIDNSNRK
ncbi:MAG: Bor family protein [Fibromonadaceae bacterium]|jgi:Asp-tRNA(Asn)/Glu-tRNA(Gln) amidotransferase C subunit|nr:Bor family protein [Fibromonadaceae bacterium]